MKISKENPPNWKEIQQFLYPDTGSNAIFCYGDTVYNVPTDTLRDDLMVHEQVHSVQQGIDPKGWWDKYLTDSQFRLGQELEAYGSQYAFLKTIVPKNNHWRVLYDLARDLSLPIYGLNIIHADAESKIRKASKLVV